MNLPIDYNRVFANIVEITNLPLKQKGRSWIGACKMNGATHERPNKLIISLKGGSVVMLEQGGECISVARWLVDYGGCNKHLDSKSNYKDAFDILRGCKPSSFVYYNKEVVVESIFVDQKQMDNTSHTDHSRNNLFIWLSSMFGENAVKEAFSLYRVRTDKWNNTVFWNINKQGKICFDKRMKYQPNGKRDHQFGGSRLFKVGKGYRKRCYFGSHLLGREGKVRLVESEKTALIGHLACGGVWIASGGANNLLEVDKDWVVYADNDEAGRKWEEQFPEQCMAWYKGSGVAEGDDIGDFIVGKKLSKKP